MPSAEPDPFCCSGPADPADPDLLMSDTTPIHDARALTKGGRVARIHLNGQIYALRITRADKLILTK